jgi:membrane protein
LRDLVLAIKNGVRDDNVVLIAAGLAYFGILSLGPAMIAVVSIYGLFASPDDVVRQVEQLTAIPDQVRELLQEQLSDIAAASASRLGIQAVVAVVVALWAASSGIRHLIVALRSIDGRPVAAGGYVRTRLRALVVTIGGVVFLVVAVALLVGAPTWIEANVSEVGGQILDVLRWPLLAVLMVAALSILYAELPEGQPLRLRWVSWGALVATAIWLLGSVGFSFYAARFGNYARTWGAMAEVIITLIWLFITAIAVLVGAEINAVLEDEDREADRT